MRQTKIAASDRGDSRYYKRAFNAGWVWSLQHKPRRQIMDTFMRMMRPREEDLVVDVGSAALPEPLENIFECCYPFKHRIVACGIEDCSFLERQYSGLRYIRVRAGEKLPFSDNAFDIGFSNATIEHVGSRDLQRAFASELVRVSRRTFLCTPNRWFPIELHTRLPLVHWLPPAAFRATLRALGFGFYAREENLNLLSARDLAGLMPKSEGGTVRLTHTRFLGVPSNIVLIAEKETR